MIEAIWIVFTFLLSLVVHELGHAWAARLCGFDVETISIGVGDTMWRTRWQRMWVQVCYPWTMFVGYVEYSDHGRGTNPQRLFVAVAGLLANTVLMVLSNFGYNYIPKLADYWGQLGVLNLGLIVLNLIPFVVMRRGYTKMWTDGGRIAGLIQEQLTGRNFTER